jgi:hypothetical protein
VSTVRSCRYSKAVIWKTEKQTGGKESIDFGKSVLVILTLLICLRIVSNYDFLLTMLGLDY